MCKLNLFDLRHFRLILVTLKIRFNVLKRDHYDFVYLSDPAESGVGPVYRYRGQRNDTRGKINHIEEESGRGAAFCAHLTSLDWTLLSTSVCPSVGPSVKRVHPEKNEISVCKYVDTVR